MRKNLTISLMLIISFFALSACTAGESENTHVNLKGTWSSSQDGVSFVAVIVEDHIEVTLKMRDSEGLYWVGTFDSLVSGPKDILSFADAEVLKASLFGSQDKKKMFRYENDGLIFTFGMANTEHTIRMTKGKI